MEGGNWNGEIEQGEKGENRVKGGIWGETGVLKEIARKGVAQFEGVTYWSRSGLIRGSVSLWRRALRSHICSSQDEYLRPLPVAFGSRC